MGSDELWETTMDPKKRSLIQLTTENMDTTLLIFETLMGKSFCGASCVYYGK